MLNHQLYLAYREILSEIDTSYLQPKNERKESLKISGLFLPTVSELYQSAPNKVMIIGSETAGWEPLWNASKKEFDQFVSVDDYISRSMSKHSNFLERQLTIAGDAKGKTFHNFLRALAGKCGKSGLVYSNLYCFDWEKGNPEKSPIYDFIKGLSKRLLDAQLEILNPEIIILANGMSRSGVEARRAIFPLEKCLNSKNYDKEGVSKHYLWEFDYGKHKCFRIHHPSAISIQATNARRLLIDLLPSGC